MSYQCLRDTLWQISQYTLGSGSSYTGAKLILKPLKSACGKPLIKFFIIINRYSFSTFSGRVGGGVRWSVGRGRRLKFFLPIFFYRKIWEVVVERLECDVTRNPGDPTGDKGVRGSAFGLPAIGYRRPVLARDRSSMLSCLMRETH